jgi:hypothetical protein
MRYHIPSGFPYPDFKKWPSLFFNSERAAKVSIFSEKRLINGRIVIAIIFTAYEDTE